MLRESGRLPFSVLYPFQRCGYDIRVDDGLAQRLVEKYRDAQGTMPTTASLSASMPGVAYTSSLPEKPSDWTLLYDRASRSTLNLPWNRRIRVAFDLFSAYRFESPIIAPYGMHPTQSLVASADHLRELRQCRRSIRALFAGDSKGYGRTWVTYPERKLPRAEVLATLRQAIPDALIEVSGGEEIGALESSGYLGRFVLCDSGSGIAPSTWLRTLAKSDFFLCPPGIVMPMCHNVVEAMSVGTIPLIGYPEWFTPALVHGTNCLAFRDGTDLIAQMNAALQAPQAVIDRMRKAVIDYYDTHIRPEALVQRIEARPERDLTLLIHTELNMARNARKLGKQSVLIRGPDVDDVWRRWGSHVVRLRRYASGCR